MLEGLPGTFYHQIVPCTSFTEFTFSSFSRSLVTLFFLLPVSAPVENLSFRFSTVALGFVCFIGTVPYSDNF